MILRTGDRVYHEPTRQSLIIAYADYETGKFAAAGTYAGEGNIQDCTIEHRCSDEAHLDAIAELAVTGSPLAERAAQIAAKNIGAVA
jgi:hypothetical protein